MSTAKLDSLILEVENFLECWKQFNYYLNLARNRQFGPQDEAQFLEIKSLLVQELEMLLMSFETGAPPKEDVHKLLALAPSLRSLSEIDTTTLLAIENHWHRIFIAWQSILGQLKVQQRQARSQSLVGRLFGRSRG